jgi:hypothetical protein
MKIEVAPDVWERLKAAYGPAAPQEPGPLGVFNGASVEIVIDPLLPSGTYKRLVPLWVSSGYPMCVPWPVDEVGLEPDDSGGYRLR